MSARDDYPALVRDAETCSATAPQAHRALAEIDRLRNEVANHQAFVLQVRQAMFLVES